jgi:hypothetical protein
MHDPDANNAFDVWAVYSYYARIEVVQRFLRAAEKQLFNRFTPYPFSCDSSKDFFKEPSSGSFFLPAI